MIICQMIFLLFLLLHVDASEQRKDEKRMPICTNIQDREFVLKDSESRNFQGHIHVGVLDSPNSQIQVELSQNEKWPPTSEFQLYHCALQLEACASCSIGIEFEPVGAHFSEFQIDRFSKCDDMTPLLEPCFNMEFIEERADGIAVNGYLFDKNDVYKKTSVWTKSDSNHYNSSGNSLLILVSMRNLASETQLFNYLLQNFPMTVSVYSNEVIVKGTSITSNSKSNQTSSGFIHLPRYPSAYAATIHQNFTIENTNSSGHVRLIFDDFHINYRSLLQVFDGEELIFDSRTAQNRRPKAIQSSTSKLRVTFNANYFTNIIGFKAKYEFVNAGKKWPDRPINCDEMLDGYGGRISLDNQDALVGNYVDCIWVVSRFPSISHTFDHIYMRLEEYQLKGRLQLEIRRGAYSEADRIFMLFEPQTKNQLIRKQPVNGFIIDSNSLQSGFYVRLRGYLESTNGLSVIYTQFLPWASGLCPGAEDEFYCGNSRCIKRSLFCDGYNHCGDNSDEICHVPTHLFEESDIDIPALLALVVGILGLFIIMVAIFGVLSRFNKHKIAFLRNNDRVLMNFLRHGRSSFTPNVINSNTTELAANGQLATNHSSTSDLAASIHTIGERRFYVLPENRIQVVEAPPTYIDALKHPTVSSYTNGGFQSYAEPDVELRSVNSLPTTNATDQEQSQQPKLCNSCTSPARINDEPGPSNQDNNTETENNTDSEQSDTNKNNTEKSDKKEEEEKQSTSKEDKSTDESKLEEVDLGIESWV